MVRKRPKVSGLTSSSISTGPKAKTPCRTRRRANENFNGKLSHTSPVSPHSKITKFFHPQEDELCSSKPCDALPPPMILRTSPRKLLTQANLNASVLQCKPLPPQGLSPTKPPKPVSPLTNTGDVLSLPSPPSGGPTPHKITSPTSALSSLSIHSPHGNNVPGMIMRGAPQQGTKKSKRCLNPVMTGNITNQVNGGSHVHVSQAQITDFFPVRRSVRKTKKTVLQERQKSLEEAVLNEQEEGLEVRMFEEKGRGIVTTRKFHRGEFVVEYAGQLITMEVAKERERQYAQDQNTGCYMYYFRHGNSQYCVDGTAESSRLGRLVNHSRNGNLITKTIEVNHEPHLVLIAREDIEPGTEITYDYGDRSKESLRHHPWLLN